MNLPEGFVPRLNGLSGRIGQRKRRVQFGEGYSQSSLDGVNPTVQEFTMDFFVWGDDDLNTLLNFFESVGAGTFSYRLPNEDTANEYEIMGLPSVSYVDKKQRQVSVQIRRAY